MTITAALAILQALMSTAPELLSLIQSAQASGSAVSEADIQAILTKYGVDRIVFASAIAASKAAGK
jgi:hypothetical protein